MIRASESAHVTRRRSLFLDSVNSVREFCFFLHCGADWFCSQKEEKKMQMSGESLAIILIVGLIAGWIAGQIWQGSGFGLVGDLVIGVLGAFFGSWLLPQLGIHLGAGLVAAIINATIGALVLLFLISLVRGRSRWGSRW
jgi:uncharacterized membrane protein YeaQ/YmgE (transglycosylase-associated protein family)